MRRFTIPTLIALGLIAGCAARVSKPPMPTTGTLAELRNVRPDVK
jgi:hypothetical protein